MEGGSGLSGQQAPPTLVLVTIDTLRADRVGSYGHDRRTTPFLDRLAAEATLFSEAISTVPLTAPSHASILTGLHPRSHAVLGNSWRLDGRFLTLAEVLRGAGYRTGAFISSIVLDPHCGLDQGFEVYEGIFPRGDRPAGAGRESGPPDKGVPAKGPPVLAKAPGRAADTALSPQLTGQRRGAETVDLALAWLKSNRGAAPLFLWVHLYDPHEPYDPPEPFRTLFGAERGGQRASHPLHLSVGRRPSAPAGEARPPGVAEGGPPAGLAASRPDPGEAKTAVAGGSGGLTLEEAARLQELYDGEVATADFHLGRLLAGLRAAGLYEDSVVAVVADHGETLGDHEGYYGHFMLLYDTSLSVPMVLKTPGQRDGALEKGAACAADLAPTLLAALGREALPSADGVDLLRPTAGKRTFFCENYLGVGPRGLAGDPLAGDGPQRRSAGRHFQALRFADWKLVLGGPGGSPLLFDLRHDPGERESVAGSRPEIVEDLQKAWQGWADGHPLSLPGNEPDASPEVDEKTRELLRRLGYAE